MESPKQAYKKQPPVDIADFVAPASMPKMGNAFTRWIGRTLMKMTGWRVAGKIPDEPHLVMAGAPHTSNWDFIHSMNVGLALGTKFSYLMKKEAFIWPFKRMFIAMGGIPVDRSRGDEIMGQMQDWFASNPACWVAITPEGTRTSVKKFKTGFLRIAQAANVPIMLVAWDYPAKVMHFMETPPLSGNIDVDVERIKAFFEENFIGRNPKR